MNMTYKETLPGIKLRVIESDRFQTNCISVQFLSRISEEVASKMTLVPRVLRRGTAKHPDMESLAAALDDMYGARIEPVSRKYGDIITSGFICDFVDLEEKSISSVFRLLGEILFDPKLCDGAFIEGYVDGERANLIDEIKSEINNKLSYALKKTVEHMFKNSAYAIDELGCEESAEKVSANSLYKFYKKMVSSYPCELFFCGNYSYSEVEREVLRMFSICPREKVIKTESEPPSYADGIRACDNMDIAQASLIIGMSTDSDDIYALRLLSAVLGGGTSSKLFANVREKESLCYSIGTMFDSFKKAMFIYAGVAHDNAHVAEMAMLREFEKCTCGDITEEEIRNAKKGMIDDLLTTEDSLYTLEGYWLRAALLGDEAAPLEAASAVKNTHDERIINAAKSFKLSTTYLLTGLEGEKNERKLLPDC